MKSLQKAGEEFLEELFRQHFGCERSQSSAIPRRASEVRALVAAAPNGGDEFVSQLLKYFNHDTSFAEDVPADGVET
jgi:hypothetical protein